MRTIVGRVIVATALCVAVGAAPGVALGQEDPSLDQRIDTDQQVAEGQVVLEAGHVDVGPVFIDGRWELMVHDDTVDPSVWRSPEDVVFLIGDGGLTQVPDDPTYAFLGAEPGASVHVVSQTQQPDVVWVGWNTQAPEVMERIDRGVTLTMLGAQGPGALSVYLQSGNFTAPDVLWQSTLPERQSIWVDVNTHTHANWVFTEPGVYLVRVEATADLLDGETAAATADLRFAIGSDTDTAEALDAELEESALGGRPESDAAAASEDAGPVDATGDGAGSGSGGLLLGLGLGAVVLVVAIVVLVLRSRSVKRRAFATSDESRT